MTKKQRWFAFCGALYLAGAIVGVYGAGFSWRQVLIGGIALLIWQTARSFMAAPSKPAFTRYQFRIGLSNFALALKTAGLHGDDLDEAAETICNGMTGNGWIIFTWLESELWYVNTTNLFTSHLELNIDLPAFGRRQRQHRFELSDTLQLCVADGAYELVLLPREQRYSKSDTTPKRVVLFKLPYEFFWALQGDPFQDRFDGHKRAEAILTAAGFTLFSVDDVPNAWDYRNEYGSIRWWSV